MPQRLTPGRFPLLVDELLDSAGSGADAARDAADRLGVGGLSTRPLHTLSGGQLQRAFLARALGCVQAGARALFADEPSAALDFTGQEQVASLLHWLFWRRRRELGLVLFDRELALCSGVNADRLVLVLLVVIAVAIGGAIRLTGALLVDALTLLPALGARNLGHSLRSMVLWAIVLGLVGNTVGFFLALVTDQPLGPVLVLVAGTFTLLTYLVPQGTFDARTPPRPRGHPVGISHPGADRLWQH